MKPRTVIIESPFAGDIYRNIGYARDCMLDSLKRGEAPFVSHLLYTQVWDDTDDTLRAAGIAAGHAWIEAADVTVVYTDHGISDGMKAGIARAHALGRICEYRKIFKNREAVNNAQGEHS